MLQAKLGRTEAERVARAALAAATAVMQAKRVEILVPPQAAAWLQVCASAIPVACVSKPCVMEALTPLDSAARCGYVCSCMLLPSNIDGNWKAKHGLQTEDRNLSSGL